MPSPARKLAMVFVIATIAPQSATAHAQAIDLMRFTMVDLTHEVAADATAWPGSRNPFKLDTIVANENSAMSRLTLNEHFATHLDAPRHASGQGWTNERIPLDRLIAPPCRRSRTLSNCDQLPRTGALLMALPIKTRGGSGGPVRVVALVPR